MTKILAIVILLFASAVANGGEGNVYKPFPEAQITEVQWEGYRRMIVDTYGASLRQFPEEHLEVLHSPDQVLHFAFTTPGHPAHPAWITRSAKDDGSVDQIGYFADEEQPFAELFQAYLAFTNRTLDSIPDEPAQSVTGFAEAKVTADAQAKSEATIAYADSWAEFNNQNHLDERDGCYFMADGALTQILEIDASGKVVGYFADKDNGRSQCWRGTYLGAVFPKPPFAPYLHKLIMH